MRPKVQIVIQMFERASSHGDYRKALTAVKKLTAHDQLPVIDVARAAAARLHVDTAAGVPKVTPRGEIVVDGRQVIVEELS
jgi:hypothetical protein